MFISLSVRRAFGAFQGIGQQHGDGHRTDAAGNRRDERRHFLGRLEIDVAAQLAIGHAVDADVDDHGAGLDHVAGDHLRLADRGDQDVGAPAVRLRSLRLRMADGDGGAGVHQQHGHRLADDVRAADHHRFLALEADARLFKNFITP